MYDNEKRDLMISYQHFSTSNSLLIINLLSAYLVPRGQCALCLICIQ